MRPRLTATADLSPLWTFDRVPGVSAWLAHTVEGTLAALDDELRPHWRVTLPPDWKGGHAIAPTLDRVAASAPDRVALYACDGSELWSHPHATWDFEEAGACAFTADGAAVWALVRTAHGDEIRLLDTADGTPRCHVPLAVPAVGAEILPHPDGVHTAAAVQHTDDTYRIHMLRPQSQGESRELPAGGTRILADIHPHGTLLLTTPTDDGPLGLLRHPDGSVVAARRSSLFPDPEEGFDLYAGFVSTELVLAASSAGRHVLFSVPDLRPVVELDYPDVNVPDWLVVRGDGVWATADPDVGRVQLWAGITG